MANSRSIILISPVEDRVFQRNNRNFATIPISGRVNVPFDDIEVRITGESLNGRLSGEWLKITCTPHQRAFNQWIELPAGGWYQLDIRTLSTGSVVGEAMIRRFGVGEVFVGAGQSNSTCCGEYPSEQVSGMVSCFSGENWEVRDDPFPGSHDYEPGTLSAGGSYYPAFGDALYNKYHVPVGIASTGQGGSRLSEWNTGGELFKWMMNRISQLGPGGFRAVLWHQGEADNEVPPGVYYQNMVRLITDSNCLAGWSFPWFVANATFTNPHRIPIPDERAAQQRLWNDGIALKGPDTDILIGDMRDCNGTGVHMSLKGLMAHGEMWAEKVGVYLDNMLQAE